jgi:3-dehydroquinate dehydratase-2
MKKILLVQGPNMQYLGKRQPELYGSTTAKELDALCLAHASRHGYQLEIMYSNAEGPVIDRIYAALDEGLDGLVMNPAAFIRAGYGLSGCLKAIPIPYIEVHMTNIEARGTQSLLAPSAVGVIAGFGVDSYRMGLEQMHRLLCKETRWNEPAR